VLLLERNDEFNTILKAITQPSKSKRNCDWEIRWFDNSQIL